MPALAWTDLSETGGHRGQTLQSHCVQRQKGGRGFQGLGPGAGVPWAQSFRLARWTAFWGQPVVTVCTIMC